LPSAEPPTPPFLPAETPSGHACPDVLPPQGRCIPKLRRNGTEDDAGRLRLQIFAAVPIEAEVKVAAEGLNPLSDLLLPRAVHHGSDARPGAARRILRITNAGTGPLPRRRPTMIGRAEFAIGIVARTKEGLHPFKAFRGLAAAHAGISCAKRSSRIVGVWGSVADDPRTARRWPSGRTSQAPMNSRRNRMSQTDRKPRFSSFGGSSQLKIVSPPPFPEIMAQKHNNFNNLGNPQKTNPCSFRLRVC
jgi:hypothetical protein